MCQTLSFGKRLKIGLNMIERAACNQVSYLSCNAAQFLRVHGQIGSLHRGGRDFNAGQVARRYLCKTLGCASAEPPALGPFTGGNLTCIREGAKHCVAHTDRCPPTYVKLFLDIGDGQTTTCSLHFECKLNKPFGSAVAHVLPFGLLA